MDEAAAALARRYTQELHVGDILTAPFPAGRFDVVTAFHVLEHVPDPVAVARRMLDWLAPGGLLIVEVPNAGGLGAALFGGAWSGLELPRHLSHFTPVTLERVIEKAGGRIVWTLAPGEAANLPVELVGALARPGLERARAIHGATAGLRGVEARAGGAGSAGALARRGEAIRIGAVRSRPT